MTLTNHNFMQNMKAEILEANQSFREGGHSAHSRVGSELNDSAPRDGRAGENGANPTDVFLQNVIDAYESSVVILNDDQKIVFVNRAWRQFASLAGVSADQPFIGRRYPDVSLGAAASSNRDAIAIAKGIRCVIENAENEFRMDYLCTAIAEPLWFRVHAAPFFLPGRNDSSMILVNHNDVTTEKLTGDRLLRDRKRLNRLLDSTKILPWEADAATGAITYVGDQAEQMLGYSKQNWFDADFWVNHLHPDDKQRAVAEFTRLSQDIGQHQHGYRMIAKNGRVVWINDIVTVHWENGRPATVSGYMIDDTERKVSEEALLQLSGRLITAQEDERKRIARELHDDLNQRMALMSIELEQLGQQLPNKTDGLSERIRELQVKAMRVSQEIHRMSYKLHPSKLDHLGLVPALKSFCSELAERRRLRINFRHEGVSSILSADITLCLFRVAQEALQNAAKHSGKSDVDVDLKITEDEATLKVSDSGCGFEMKTGKNSEGLGFISMRERLRLVNGFLAIQSKPFQGTKVTVSVPLSGDRSLRDIRAQNIQIF